MGSLTLQRREVQTAFIDTPDGAMIIIEVKQTSSGSTVLNFKAPQRFNIRRDNIRHPRPISAGGGHA
jgi:hypothetical protein